MYCNSDPGGVMSAYEAEIKTLFLAFLQPIRSISWSFHQIVSEFTNRCKYPGVQYGKIIPLAAR